jgi:nicotinamidase-related amidase
VTPLRFPCPSAPRIPGQGTFTPKHDSMHGTHAWDEPRVRDAVTRTGRQKLLIGGITTHVCLAFPAMSAVADGYDVYALLDASGTWSDLLRLTAIDQMRQAGVTITSGAAAFVEMLHDNASPIAAQFYAALDLPATRYLLQITQEGKSA